MSGDLRTSLCAAALDTARRGFPVFPLEPGKKTPAVKGWQEWATTDEALIRKVWTHGDYNIGVKTGGGLFVTDIDVKAGKQGAQAFADLHLTAAEKTTFRVRTASGGWHVYYRGEGFGNSAGRLGPGLDTRCEGGYVVGPGSVLTNGSGQGRYEIDLDHDLVDIPGEIRGRLSLRRDAIERRTDPLVDLDRADAIDRAIVYLRDTAPTSGTYAVACRLKDFGVSKETATPLLDEHWNPRRAQPHTYEELQEKVDHAWAYGVNPPGSDHPVAAFGDVALEAPPSAITPEPSRWHRHGDVRDLKVQWLYYEVLPMMGVAVIVGQPQSGKTFVDVELGRSVATGKPFFGVNPDDRGGVAFLFAGTEGSAMETRLAALGETEDLPISWTTVSDLSAKGALGQLLTDLRAESKRMVDVFGVPLRLVVLETLNASGLLTDENDNAEIGMAFANLGTLSRELNALVLTTHHPPKNGEGARGGGAIVASADYVLEITRQGKEQVRYLELTKARDAEQRQLGTFTLLKQELGLDSRGRPITSMVVSPGAPMVKQGRRADHSETFMQALDFAIMESTSAPEGHKAAEWDDVYRCFNDIRPSKGRDGSTVFKRCVEYARDIGAIDTGVFAGARFIWKKELT